MSFMEAYRDTFTHYVKTMVFLRDHTEESIRLELWDTQLLGESIQDIFRMDLVSYMLYVASAEGDIPDHMLNVIYGCTDLDLPKVRLRDFARREELLDDSFAQHVPATFLYALYVDQYASAEICGPEGGSLLQQFVDFYEEVTDHLLQACGGREEPYLRRAHAFWDHLLEKLQQFADT